MKFRKIVQQFPSIVKIYRFFYRVYYTLYLRMASATIDLEGHTVLIGNDLGMRKSYLKPGYFTCFIDAIEHYVHPGDVVFDIGAHIGATAILLSNRVGGSGKVYAFEPIPELHNQLENNIKNNGIENIEIVTSAVSNKQGTVKFFVNTAHTGYNSIDRGNALDYLKADKDVHEVIVDSIKLDDFVNEIGVRPSFIKIDCQGAEYEILKGASLLLREERPARLNIYLEFWPMAIRNVSSIEPEEFMCFLENEGFKIAFAEDCGELIADGTVSDTRKAEFVTAVATLEKGYTNLMLTRQ